MPHSARGVARHNEKEWSCCFWEPKHHRRMLAPIMAAKVEGAIQKGLVASALGPEGLTYEFYAAHQSTLAPWLSRVYNKSLCGGRLPPSQLDQKLSL